jgi:hypothetical protein
VMNTPLRSKLAVFLMSFISGGSGEAEDSHG